jgi:hypothetical protein
VEKVHGELSLVVDGELGVFEFEEAKKTVRTIFKNCMYFRLEEMNFECGYTIPTSCSAHTLGE